MRGLSQGKFRQQITFLRRQFLQEVDLPFRDVLSEALVQEALIPVSRLYKDGDEWKQTDSFGRDDLQLLAKVIDLAHTWIFEQAT